MTKPLTLANAGSQLETGIRIYWNPTEIDSPGVGHRELGSESSPLTRVSQFLTVPLLRPDALQLNGHTIFIGTLTAQAWRARGLLTLHPLKSQTKPDKEIRHGSDRVDPRPVNSTIGFSRPRSNQTQADPVWVIRNFRRGGSLPDLLNL